MKRLLAILILAAQCLVLLAGDIGPVFIPNAETVVTHQNVRLKRLYLANVTAGATTVTIKDRTANCNGGACQLWPAVTIAANSVYTVDMGAIQADGVTWSASAANSVVGGMSW